MNSLDRTINNDFLVITKSLLPYLNTDRQKPLAIFIKVMELIYTVNIFSDQKLVRSMSRSQESGWEKSFLNDIRSNIGEDKAYFIDIILKLAEAKTLLAHHEQASAEAKHYTPADYHLHPLDSGIPESQPFPDEILKTPKNPAFPNRTTPPPSSTPSPAPTNTSSANPEQLIQSLSSMLDPNQTQLLKVLTSLLTSSSSHS